MSRYAVGMVLYVQFSHTRAAAIRERLDDVLANRLLAHLAAYRAAFSHPLTEQRPRQRVSLAVGLAVSFIAGEQNVSWQ